MAATTLASEVGVVVLESTDRTGGRVETVRQGNCWINVGTQFTEGTGMLIDALDRHDIEWFPRGQEHRSEPAATIVRSWSAPSPTRSGRSDGTSTSGFRRLNCHSRRCSGAGKPRSLTLIAGAWSGGADRLVRVCLLPGKCRSFAVEGCEFFLPRAARSGSGLIESGRDPRNSAGGGSRVFESECSPETSVLWFDNGRPVPKLLELESNSS
ncbi:FAD-dependent oxidoreductase [Nocardia sp. NPDC051833]|uniref:FAD-dependent oxidoreductase n=1 Tax=Nocardia sp. NPDC051833 TaxID=3155674 RepID=UPI003412554B